MSPRPARPAEIAPARDGRLAPPEEIALAIALAAESIEVGPAPARQRSGWPSGPSYVWRFSALTWSRQVTDRRERP